MSNRIVRKDIIIFDGLHVNEHCFHHEYLPVKLDRIDNILRVVSLLNVGGHCSPHPIIFIDQNNVYQTSRHPFSHQFTKAQLTESHQSHAIMLILFSSLYVQEISPFSF